ncbi:CopG family transcriptional regulator [Bradyrhizobium sp. Tv2a-2]|uniref:CopG family transcriptional regulator n=1 Tax=Bradyrhizobium sp. Tv2a-2 TaxID=113395 RepID=UPI00042286CD|nr:CopG family transcriptional regulator [Bradyrhizobium sp. Tv2a-2]
MKWGFERRGVKKTQLSIYLDPEIFGELEAFAKRHGKPKSLVAEAAIASFLSPDDSDRREAAISKRLDRIVRVLERLERNDNVTLETIALFIRFWLTSTPALPEQSSPAARAKGSERYDRFVEALGRRLASGSTILKEVSLESDHAASLNPTKGEAGSA